MLSIYGFSQIILERSVTTVNIVSQYYIGHSP